MKLSKTVTPLTVFVILLVVVTAGLAIRFLPWPTGVDLRFHAAEIGEDGNVIDTGEIVIRGTRLNYLFESDGFEYEELTFLDQSFVSNNDDRTGYDSSFHFSYPAGSSYELLIGTDCEFFYEEDHLYTIYRFVIYVSLEQDWCVVEFTDDAGTHFFVGSLDESLDPQEVLNHILTTAE